MIVHVRSLNIADGKAAREIRPEEQTRCLMAIPEELGSPKLSSLEFSILFEGQICGLLGDPVSRLTPFF